MKKNKVGGINLRHIMLVALFFGVLAQLKHFYKSIVSIFSVNNSGVEFEAVLFCIAFGMAIMIWTARGKQGLVIFFSAVEMIINAYYTFEHSSSGMNMAMGLLLGVVLPLSNFFYGEELMFPNANVKKVKKKKKKAVPMPIGV